MSYIKHKPEESMEDYLETILVLSQKKAKFVPLTLPENLDLQKQV